MSEYKSNSDRSKEVVKEQRVQKVISGDVKTKKSLKDLFIASSAEDIKSYVIYDVLIPAAKRTIEEVVSMILNGSKGGRSNPRGGGVPASRVSYDSYFGRPEVQRAPTRPVLNYNEVAFENILDAEKVLNGLQDLINRYKVARLADFYDLAGVPDNSYMSSNRYGWTSIEGTRPERLRNGDYILRLPRIMQLD